MKQVFVGILLFSILLFTSCNSSNSKKVDYKPLSKEEVEANLKDDEIDPEYKRQLENLVAMMDQHPQSAKLYAERANLFVLMKKTMQALHDIDMAVELDPDNSDYHTNKAQLLRQFKRNEEALEELMTAIKLDPKSVGAHFNRGALYFNTNNFEKALKDFSFCINQRPEVAPPYFNRAFTYEQLHDFSSAKKDLQKFVEISNNPEWKRMAGDKLEEWDKVDYKTIIDDPARLESMGMKKESVK